MCVKLPQNQSPGVDPDGYGALKRLRDPGLTPPQKNPKHKCDEGGDLENGFSDVRFSQALHIADWHLKTLMDAALSLTKDVPDARASVSNRCQPLNETPRQTLLCEHICPSPKKK